MLTLEGLSARYGRIAALDSVSLTVGAAEFVCLIGANGAGKTTTLKMLAGLLHPTGGEALVLGRVPWRREKEYLRNISLVMGNRNQLMWDIPAMDSFLWPYEPRALEASVPDAPLLRRWYWLLVACVPSPVAAVQRCRPVRAPPGSAGCAVPGPPAHAFRPSSVGVRS